MTIPSAIECANLFRESKGDEGLNDNCYLVVLDHMRKLSPFDRYMGYLDIKRHIQLTTITPRTP